MTIYLVRRHDGTFMRYGGNWGDMEGAQVYTTPGPAKSRITKWARLYPAEPTLSLLTFTFTAADMQVVDMTSVTAKSVGRIQRRKMEAAQRAADEEVIRLWRKHAEIVARLQTLQPSP
jgi:hypothetical protein